MFSARPLFFIAFALTFASCEAVTSPLDDPDAGTAMRPAASVQFEADWSTRTVALCHPTSKESEAYERILVTNEAARVHLAHGDELAGGATFDDACQPVIVTAACGCFAAEDLAAPLDGAQPLSYLFSDVFNYYNEDARRTELRSTISTDTGLLEEVASVYITATGDPAAPLMPLCFRQDATLDAMPGAPIYTYTTREVSIDEAEACRLDMESVAEGQQTCQGGACDLPYTEEQLDPSYPPYHDGGYDTPGSVLDAMRARIDAVRVRLALPA